MIDKYVTIPKRDHDLDLEKEEEEQEMLFTGLYNQSGEPIYKRSSKIQAGFII